MIDGHDITIDDEDLDEQLQNLITHFYPDAEINQTDDLIMKRYEDIKLQLVDLIMDIWDEKSKYKVYVYEAYSKVYEVKADSEISAIVEIEQNGERMNEVQITKKIKGQILPKKIKLEEFRIEEVVI